MSSAIRFLVLVTLILQLMAFLGPAMGENIAGKTYYCRAWYPIDREKEWPEDGWPSRWAATAVHSKGGPIETTFGYLEQDPKALTAEEKGLPDFWRENQRRLAKKGAYGDIAVVRFKKGYRAEISFIKKGYDTLSYEADFEENWQGQGVFEIHYYWKTKNSFKRTGVVYFNPENLEIFHWNLKEIAECSRD